jgi:hypothetical protein
MMANTSPVPMPKVSFPVFFDKQIQQGTFEFDLSVFDGRFRNDETGAQPYDPRSLTEDYSFGIFPRYGLQQKDCQVL